MPVYAYKGVSGSGKSIKGSVSADSLRAARAKMRVDGVYLTNIREVDASVEVKASESAPSRWTFKLPTRIPSTERAVTTRQLATLISAGIPVVESLSALVEQIDHGALKAVFAQVRDRVNEGASLADAMAATDNFDTLYVSMIRAGEASGALDTVLERIADYLEDQVRLNSKVTSILVYPAVMLAFVGVVIAVLVTVVLPQITGLLLSLDQELPFYTRFVISGSEIIRSYWWLIGLGFVGLIAAYRAFVRTEAGRTAVDRFVLKLPVVGRVVRIIAIARFSRTLSSLLAGGVNIVQSMTIARHVTNNAVLAEAVDEARTAILEGGSLARPLRASGHFPPMVTTMIEVGERAGDLEAMLTKVAETYDGQVETTVTRLTALLEPLLILVMVGIVMFIIMATLMPLLSITNSLH
ncbi:MAG: type II secretion system F family protein [Deltaproteobacteria bacterium]|nr:type II secretion system F family protein [Deltaproteobacteria bacterium]